MTVLDMCGAAPRGPLQVLFKVLPVTKVLRAFKALLESEEQLAHLEPKVMLEFKVCKAPKAMLAQMAQ